MKNLTIICLCLSVLSCQTEQPKADAYGNFEATVLSVSAQKQGQIKMLKLREGQPLDSGAYVGYIDTTDLHLQKQQLKAQYAAVRSQSPGISAQVEVLKEQLRAARDEMERFKALSEKGAVPQKQVDDIRDRIAILQKQIDQAKTQDEPIFRELQALNTKMKMLDEQIENAKIMAPVKGTVLLQLKQRGEVVGPGMPVFRMADLDTLILNAYISGAQLTEVELGQEVRVEVDRTKNEMQTYRGRLQKIAEEAEFTPKSIQTKEERVDLVYAIEIAVPNDGKLKIGMPAEVYFNNNQ